MTREEFIRDFSYFRKKGYPMTGISHYGRCNYRVDFTTEEEAERFARVIKYQFPEELFDTHLMIRRRGPGSYRLTGSRIPVEE